jgi:hypothetical protein
VGEGQRKCLSFKFFAVRRGRPGLANQCNGRASQFHGLLSSILATVRLALRCQFPGGGRRGGRATARATAEGAVLGSRAAYHQVLGGRRRRRLLLLRYHRVAAPRLGHCR